MKIKNDIKIPFIDRTVIAGTFVHELGLVEKEPKFVKVRIVEVPLNERMDPIAGVNDVYALERKSLK